MKKARSRRISWRYASTMHPFIADSAYNTESMSIKELKTLKILLTWSTKKTGAVLAESKN